MVSTCQANSPYCVCNKELMWTVRGRRTFKTMLFVFLMLRRPPRSTQRRSSAASDVYKRQGPAAPDRLQQRHRPIAHPGLRALLVHAARRHPRSSLLLSAGRANGNTSPTGSWNPARAGCYRGALEITITIPLRRPARSASGDVGGGLEPLGASVIVICGTVPMMLSSTTVSVSPSSV